MDDIVRQAIAKWPNVPDCYGWLGLDSRGNWWLRDDQTQAQGGFPQARGNLVEHDKLLAFIGRNYDADALGRWYFQNGPQRVYVELERTPMIWRVHADGRVVGHTGLSAQVDSCWLDELGLVYLLCDGVLGLVHSQDMLHLAQQVEDGRWEPQAVLQAELPQRFGFEPSPQQRQKGGAGD